MKAYWGSGGIAPRLDHFTLTEKAPGTHGRDLMLDTCLYHPILIDKVILITFGEVQFSRSQ